MNLRLKRPLWLRWQGWTAHYAYFRKAEYPMRPPAAAYWAYRMGWCEWRQK